MLEFTLRLTSDAQPGTGLGGELVNDRFPRDHQGNPTIPGSHLKGLLRQQWQLMAPHLGLSDAKKLEDALFGTSFADDTNPTAQATALRIPDLTWVPGPSQQGGLAARTAIADPDAGESAGTAKATSLRVVETIPAGTSFRGSITWSGQDPRLEPALRLALIGLEAIGGSRRRGCGRCVITVTEKDNPGKTSPQELKKLIDSLREKPQPQQQDAKPGLLPPDNQDGDPCWFQLTFNAKEPVLCPQHPEAANHIPGAACIPASAVLGAIISRIAELHGPKVADRLLSSSAFRTGPLLPSGFAGTGSQGLAQVAPLSLRIAKRSDQPVKDGKRTSYDELLHPEDHDLVDSPKAINGSLVHTKDGLRFLKPGDLPHLVRAQVALDESRRTTGDRGPHLYSVDAIGPCCWSGLVCLPAAWETVVKTALAQIAFGRRRSTLGSGTCDLAPAPAARLAQALGAGQTLALVAQSPVLVSKYTSLVEAQYLPDPASTLRDHLRSWIQAYKLPLEIADKGACRASLSVIFGWNRHGKKSQTPDLVLRKGLQTPDLVLIPGSTAVLAVTGPLDPQQLHHALVRGLGDGRDRGYGTIMPHPGTDIAGALPLDPSDPKKKPAPPPSLPASDPLIGWALKWATRPDELPSPSQIAQIITLIATGNLTKVTAFLDKQKERPRFQDDFAPLQQALIPGPGNAEPDLVQKAFNGLDQPANQRRLITAFNQRRLITALRIIQDIAITLRPQEARA